MSMYEDIVGKKKKKKEEEKYVMPNWVKEEGKVKSQTKTNDNSWLKSSLGTEKIKKAWSDGYDFGDITDTLLGVKDIAVGTAKDIATNVGKGFMSTIEGSVDTFRYLNSDSIRAKGKVAEEYAKKNNLNVNTDLLNELYEKSNKIKKNAQYDVTATLLGENDDLFKNNWSARVDAQSVLGNKADSVSQGVGNVGAFIALGQLTGGSNLSTFVNSFTSAYGNSRTEAYKNGADDVTANRYGVISGLSEAISEQFFSGIPNLASAGWGDKLSGRLSQSISKYLGSKGGKIALTLFDGIGEGTEEILSNMFNAIGTDVMHYIDKNYTYGMENMSGNAGKDALDAMFSQDSLDSFISAMFTSILTGGGKSLVQSVQTNQASNQVAKQGNITKQQANELINQIAEKRVDLDLDEKANYKERTEAIDNQKQLIAQEINRAIKEGKQVDLNKMLKETPNSRKEVQFKLSQDEIKNIKSDNQRVLVEDMARLNNVKENHDLYKTINAIQGANKTQQYHITTTEGLYEMGIVDKDANGNYTMPDGSPYVPRGLNYKDGDIYINADVGNQSGTQAMYHEMFEGFKKASPEQYNEFKQMVTDIIGEEAIQKEYDTYKSMYGEELTDDIRDEIINDKFGELAENKDFINRISDNRTLLQKFIDTIKDMVNYVKGTQQERELIKLQRNLEKEFAKRYKETDFSGNKGETAYSMAKHYGDLGKGNDTYYTNMSGSRSTGHFGTGTYFVNENYQPGENSSYANRPAQKVEFDDYDNLYKPSTETEGFTLHDGLKAINSKVIFEENMINEFQTALDNYNDTLSEKSLNNLMSLLEKNDYQTDDIQKLFDEGNSTQAENRLINRVEDIIDNYDTKIRDYSKMVDMLVEKTNLTRPQIQEAFVKARNKLVEYNKEGYKYGQYPTAKVDSLSTIFMKELGYNGIDVRGLDQLDNTTYGSVIYDLDNKKATTKYSLTKDSQGRTLSKEQQEYFKDSKVRDNEGRLLEVYHGTPNAGFTIYDSNRLGETSGAEDTSLGFHLTDNIELASFFSGIVNDESYNEAKNEIYSKYNIGENETLPFDMMAKVNQEIEELAQTKAKEKGEVKHQYINITKPLSIFADYGISEEQLAKDILYATDEEGRTDASEISDGYFEDNKEFMLSIQQNFDNQLEYLKDDLAKPESIKKLKELGYDGLILPMTRTDSTTIKGRGQEYIVFNSNQIKNVDNLNPTEDADIRYSMTSNENIDSKEIAPIGSTIRENLSNLNKKIDNLSNRIETLQNGLENTSQGYIETYNQQRNENIPTRQLTEEDANTLQDALMQDEGYLRSLDEQANLNTENTKLVDKLTNEITRRLDLERGQKDTLRNIINESIENGYSADEISEALQKEFSEKSYEITYHEAVDARKLIRDMPIKVSDAVKKDIADYGKWKQSNFGKINFSNSGGAVDVVYAELNNRMPFFFPSDIINPSDQLLKIAEVANMATKATETFDIDADEFDDIADYIKNTLLEDEYSAQMQSQYDLEKNIQFDNTEDILPTTIRTQDSVDEYIENRDIAPVKQDTAQQRAERFERNKNAWRKFREMITNRNAVIDDISKITGNTEIKYAGDNLNSVSGEANFNINNSQTDINGNWIGKGITQIFEPSRQAGLYEVFNDYLFNKSNIERHRVGKGSQVPEAVSEQLVKQYETQYPEVKEWAKDVYKYLDNVLQEEVDSGLITQEQFNNYRGEDGIYRSYVPFYFDADTSRYFDNEGNVRPVSTLKRSKGNASDVSQLLSMEDAMAKQTYAYKRAIRQNELYKQIVDSLEKFSDAMDMDIRDNPNNLQDSLYVTPDGDYILSAYMNGEKVSAKITEELYNELAGENEARIKQLEEDFSLITNPVQKASNIRRKLLTTWNPVFLARNAIKDIQDAVINSKHTKDMLLNYFGIGSKSAFNELRKAQTKEAQQFLALYGAENLLGDYGGKSNKLARVNELIELAPRFAEFKATLENGGSVSEAIYNAREVTTNFGRGGYITKALNRNGFTFLNANVQGLSKLVRNLSGENGVKGVTSVVVKGAVFAVLPSILNHLLYGLGDDKDEEYEALPDYIKDNYYLIKTEGNHFVRIPKGRINAVFGSLARRMIEAGEGEGFDAKEWGENAWSQIGVGDSGGLQTIFTPLQQAFGSKNGTAWYGGDIVPTRLQNKPAGEQTDASIDAVSNFVGENLGISPYKINYVLDQYSGGIGDVFLPMITPESSSGAEKPHEYLLAPIKDAFVVNSTDDNKYAGDFYDLKDKLEIQSNSEKATDEDKIKYKYMSGISKDMSELYKEKREVQADTTLSKKQKYNRVQIIQNEINNLAKEALSNYQNVSSSENYSNVSDAEYYKNSEGKWTEVKDDEEEFTAGLTNAEKDLYYKTKNKIGDISSVYSAKLKQLDKNDPAKSQLYADRKEDITRAIVNSGLDNETKAMVYAKYYSNKDNMTNAVNAGYNIDTYITALNDIDQLRTKYSQKNGYSIEKRKQKTLAYINSLEMDIPQKAMLVRQYYTSFRDYNNDIVNYVSNLDIPYEDKLEILKGTGMTIKGNNVSWK